MRDVHETSTAYSPLPDAAVQEVPTVKRTRLRGRFWVEAALAVIAGLLTVLTIAVPEWIEVAFNIDPDQGSGLLELGITLGAIAAALVSIVSAALEWLRAARSSVSPAAEP